MLTPDEKVQLTARLLKTAQDLYLKGITPSVASIKAKAGGDIPLPCIVEAMTMWNQMDKSHLNKLKLEGVTDLQDEDGEEPKADDNQEGECEPDFAIMDRSKEAGLSPKDPLAGKSASSARRLSHFYSYPKNHPVLLQNDHQSQNLLKELIAAIKEQNLELKKLSSSFEAFRQEVIPLLSKMTDSSDPK